MEDFIQPNKVNLKIIPISEFADFMQNDYPKKSKTEILTKNIEQWIITNFNKTIHENDMMPSKKLMSDLLDVSIGTIQNIYRNLEDKGLLYSKQCIGTMIADVNNKNKKIRKSSSKKDLAVELIKLFISKNKLKTNSQLPSARAISKYIGIPINTTKTALEVLVIQGIIEKSKNKDMCWILKKTDFEISDISEKKLIFNISADLKTYISNNLKIGDKMPTHEELTKILKVSVKTIHDSLKILIDEGIIITKRGQYGSFIAKMPQTSNLQPQIETSIFAKSQITAKYHYQRIEDSIKKIITEKYSIHSKLLSIMEMANLLDVSPNTVRKVYSILAKEGYLTFTRGRYGGTYIAKMPKLPAKQTFEWLAFNHDYNI